MSIIKIVVDKTRTNSATSDFADILSAVSQLTRQIKEVRVEIKSGE